MLLGWCCRCFLLLLLHQLLQAVVAVYDAQRTSFNTLPKTALAHKSAYQKYPPPLPSPVFPFTWEGWVTASPPPLTPSLSSTREMRWKEMGHVFNRPALPTPPLPMFLRGRPRLTPSNFYRFFLLSAFAVLLTTSRRLHRSKSTFESRTKSTSQGPFLPRPFPLLTLSPCSSHVGDKME